MPLKTWPKRLDLVDQDYHFGVRKLLLLIMHTSCLLFILTFFCYKDITKGAISSISEPVTAALSGAENSLNLVREANIHELVALTNQCGPEI